MPRLSWSLGFPVSPSPRLASSHWSHVGGWLLFCFLHGVGSQRLFFSETVFAQTAQNSAIEIFNPGCFSVSLSEYTLRTAPYGASFAQATDVALSGTLAANGVHVLCNSLSSSSLKAKCNQAVNTAITIEGKKLGLYHHGVLIDVIGSDNRWGGQGYNVFGVVNATFRNTIFRKPGVTEGSVDWDTPNGQNNMDAYSSQWNVTSSSNSVGSHSVSSEGCVDISQTAVRQITCGSRATDMALQTTGAVLQLLCPSDCLNKPGLMYGADQYTLASSICLAAIHARALTLESAVTEALFSDIFSAEMTLMCQTGKVVVAGAAVREFGNLSTSLILPTSAPTTSPTPSTASTLIRLHLLSDAQPFYLGCIKEISLPLGLVRMSDDKGASYSAMRAAAIASSQNYFAIGRYGFPQGVGYLFNNNPPFDPDEGMACYTACNDDATKACGCSDDQSLGKANADCGDELRHFAVYGFFPRSRRLCVTSDGSYSGRYFTVYGIGAALCPNDCSALGSCNPSTGRCNCKAGYSGSDCSVKVCAIPCYNGGSCGADGVCQCPGGFSGHGCLKKSCPNGCTDAEHGVCDTSSGVCTCNAPFYGNDCHIKLCSNNCNGNGSCDYETGLCYCYNGYFGTECSLKYCAKPCEQFGACDYRTGQCTCLAGSDYPAGHCNTGSCPGDCSGHGQCDVTSRRCTCEYGFVGEDCSRPV